MRRKRVENENGRLPLSQAWPTVEIEDTHCNGIGALHLWLKRMNNGLLEHLEAFVAIAESGSVTAASIAMGTTQATLSRQLASLEKHLGCRLFHRSTRAISLTQDGEACLQHALRMLELKHDAESALQERGGRLRGRLRVACSNGFGRKLLIPALREWQKEHPQLAMELVLSDQLSQLIEDRVDVAFRMAPLKDSNLIARPIGISRRIVVASPAYIRQHGRIKNPEDLQGHRCLIFTGAKRPGIWVASSHCPTTA